MEKRGPWDHGNGTAAQKGVRRDPKFPPALAVTRHEKLSRSSPTQGQPEGQGTAAGSPAAPARPVALSVSMYGEMLEGIYKEG